MFFGGVSGNGVQPRSKRAGGGDAHAGTDATRLCRAIGGHNSGGGSGAGFSAGGDCYQLRIGLRAAGKHFQRQMTKMQRKPQHGCNRGK